MQNTVTSLTGDASKSWCQMAFMHLEGKVRLAYVSACCWYRDLLTCPDLQPLAVHHLKPGMASRVAFVLSVS